MYRVICLTATLQKGGANMEKSPIFIGAVSPMDGQTGISLAPNEAHSRQRRALAYPFSNGALLQQQEILQRHVDKLIAALRKMAADRRPVDFSDWCKSRRLLFTHAYLSLSLFKKKKKGKT